MIYPTSELSIPEAARSYAALGLAPIPLHGVVDGRCTCGNESCHAQGKHPMHAGWQKSATTDPATVNAAFRGHTGNVGVALLGKYVLIDYDGDPGFQELLKINPPLTAHQRSGSGKGGHFIYRLTSSQDANRITDRRIKPGLDIKVRGQFVAAPSLHASGGRYRWLNDAPIAALPDSLYELIAKPIEPAPRPSSTPPSNASAKRIRAYVAKMPAAVAGQGGHAATFAVAQVIAKNIADPGEQWALLAEYNARCEPPWSERELQHKLSDAVRVGRFEPLPDRTPDRLARQPQPEPASDDAPTVARPPLRLADPAVDEDWRSRLLWSAPNKSGETQLLRVPENAAVILANDPDWSGRVSYDTFSSRVNVCGSPVDPGGTAPRAWSDVDTTRTEGWLARHHGLVLQWAAVDRAVQQVAHDNRRSSLTAWLDGITWDGTPRVAEWLTTYLGVEAGEWPRLCGQWWLISAVARAYRPGCKADHALILEGPQGTGKSSALDALVPRDEWRSDTPLELGHKDAMQSLPGRWIVELAELDSLLRARSNEAAKAFFSSRIDTYRPSHGRYTIQVPRQSVFAGTHNPAGGYLTDETGNRRLWPVLCGTIDLPALRRDRDQLWAEAVTLFRSGARWYPATTDEHNLAAAAQAARVTDDDPWVELIVPYLSLRNDVTISDVLSNAIRVREQDWSRRDQMRVAAILRGLGWHRKQVREGHRRHWVYARSDDSHPQEQEQIPW